MQGVGPGLAGRPRPPRSSQSLISVPAGVGPAGPAARAPPRFLQIRTSGGLRGLRSCLPCAGHTGIRAIIHHGTEQSSAIPSLHRLVTINMPEYALVGGGYGDTLAPIRHTRAGKNATRNLCATDVCLEVGSHRRSPFSAQVHTQV